MRSEHIDRAVDVEEEYMKLCQRIRPFNQNQTSFKISQSNVLDSADMKHNKPQKHWSKGWQNQISANVQSQISKTC